MSIRISGTDPCAKNVSRLLKAIAEYIDHNQKISFDVELNFVAKKES